MVSVDDGSSRSSNPRPALVVQGFCDCRIIENGSAITDTRVGSHKWHSAGRRPGSRVPNDFTLSTVFSQGIETLHSVQKAEPTSRIAVRILRISNETVRPSSRRAGQKAKDAGVTFAVTYSFFSV